MWTCGLQIRVVEGAARGSIHPLDAPQMTIGRTPAGSAVRRVGWVHVKDETVSGIQAELHWNEQSRRYTLINRSETNPTKVNEVEVSEIELQPGDQIRMGKCVLDLQQADMRFGGKSFAREPRPETLPPPPPPIPPLIAAPPHGIQASQSREAQDTQKSARAVSLTARPNFYLEILEGPNAGQQLAVRGNTLALGGAVDPAQASEETPWFDQEFAFGDVSIPARCLALVWKESHFELLCPDESQVEVRVTREDDGMEWVALLPAGQAGEVLAGDRVQLGRNRFQIVAGRAE
jgi:hypothetical protein